MTAAPTFTVSQIAKALSVSRQSAAWKLRGGVSPTGFSYVKGGAVPAFAIASLPAKMQEDLKAAAKRRSFDSVEQLLAAPVTAWQPKIPFSQVAKEYQDKAIKLQKAMLPSLERQDSTLLTAAEKDRLGLEDYRRVFGHAISGRYWRELLSRTIERDGGAENWQRLDIYLDQNPAPAPAGTIRPLSASAKEFEFLHTVISSFANPAAPSRTELASLWLKSIKHYNGEVEAGKKPRTVKRALLHFLWQSAPMLARSLNALRVNFDRKLAEWIESDGADLLTDGREEKKGEQRAKPYDSESIDKIVWHAVANCGGRVRQAVREMVETEQLDPDLRRAFLTAPNKSWIPKRLDEAVRYEVKALASRHQGARATDKGRVSLKLHYRGISAMTCLMADDFTWPVKMRVPDGKGWWTLTRGQCLLVIDFRTLAVLGYCLIPSPQYHSEAIRTVFAKVFDQYGCPSILYLERGLWRTSKLIVGDADFRRCLQEKDMPFSWEHCEMGLRQFVKDIIHAKRARSKPVERVGGLLQDYMERLPGYCGREERYDCPEETIRWERELACKNEAALKHFYTFDQWFARLEEIIECYNAAAQDGQRLVRMSPKEGFNKFVNPNEEPRKFDPSCRYLLAHHKIPVTVKDGGQGWGGISLRGGKYRYFGESLSRWRHHHMLAWVNFEAPEIITVTDRHGRNAFCVERANEVSALAELTGETETYEQELARVEAFESYPNTRYRTLKLKYGGGYREVVGSRAEVQTGVEIEEQEKIVQTRRRKEASRVRSIKQDVDRAGFTTEILNSDAGPGVKRYLAAKQKPAQNETARDSKEAQ